jgi:hypothetical protein
MEALNIGTCGVNTVVRLRPILIFEEQHGRGPNDHY